MGTNVLAMSLTQSAIGWDSSHDSADFAGWRKDKDLWLYSDPRVIAESDRRIAILKTRSLAIRIFSDNSKTGSKVNRIKGASVNTSVGLTCSPTAQCADCYASEPGAHITRLDSLIAGITRDRFMRLDPIAFADRLAWELAIPRFARRIYSPVLGAPMLRWFGSGDLTLASARAIVETAKKMPGAIMGIFTRKPEPLRYLLRLADSERIADRLSVNFSVDGTPGEEKNARNLARLDATGIMDRLRLVQFTRPGDTVDARARVTFPLHTKSGGKLALPMVKIPTDCPAIATKGAIGCLDCGYCFTPTA